MITITAPEAFMWLVLIDVVFRFYLIILKFHRNESSDNWVSIDDPPKKDGPYFVYLESNEFDNDIFEDGKFTFGSVIYWQPLIEAPARKTNRRKPMARHKDNG